MNCSNCGGPAELVAGKDYFRCGYCSSYLFPDATDEGVRPLGEPAGARCPECREELVTASAEEVPVRFCPNCRGILAFPPEFSEILRRWRGVPGQAVRQPEKISEVELARKVDCPFCAVPMHAHPYFGPGNAVIDTCDECLAIWLDHSELSVIAEAVRTHG